MPENLRILEKLDQIQANQATVAADVARVQGAQSGMQTAIEAVSHAIGDVMETRLAATKTSTQLEAMTDRLRTMEQNINERILGIEKKVNDKDTRTWIEQLVKFAVAGIAGGGALGLAHRFLP